MFVCAFKQCAHTAATTRTIISVCYKCGIIKRSGKMSCCGRGGSWYGNCGSTGNTKLDHTWHEGLHACKARAHSKAVIGQQLNGDEQQKNDSSNAGSTNSKAVTTTARPRTFTAAPTPGVPSVTRTPTNTFTAYPALRINYKPVTTIIFKSANIPTATPSITTANKSITTSARMQMSHNSTKVSMAAPVHVTVTSQGRKQLLEVTIYIRLLLTIALLKP